MLQLVQDPDLFKYLLNYILDTPGGRRSVARIARTCRSTMDPALDTLWRELDSLVPLLSLMPGNLFKRPKRPGLGFVSNFRVLVIRVLSFCYRTKSPSHKTGLNS